MGMSEDEMQDEMTADRTEDRFVIEIRGEAVWVVDLLADAGTAGPDLRFVKAFAGPDRLMRALDEAGRLNRREAAGTPLAAHEGAAPQSGGRAPAMAVRAADARRRRLEHMLQQAREIQDEALAMVAQDAKTLRRATDLVERLKGRLAKDAETALSESLTAQDAYRVLGDALRGLALEDRSERAARAGDECRCPGTPHRGHLLAERPCPLLPGDGCRCPGSCGHGSEA